MTWAQTATHGQWYLREIFSYAVFHDAPEVDLAAWFGRDAGSPHSNGGLRVSEEVGAGSNGYLRNIMDVTSV
jgi:hypothetical protein